MAESHSITNTYMAYISNTPYSYPPDNNATVSNANGAQAFLTGWSPIPNMLWKHFVTPKQWAELLIKYEAYHVDSIHITVFNMIPMTTQLAIQGNTLFTAFNNTIYALGYQDTLYETSWAPWLDKDFYAVPNLAWKEGLIFNVGAATKKRAQLPIYSWQQPTTRVQSAETMSNSSINQAGNGVFPNGGLPSGLFWDPFNRPEHLKELRPGKNAIHYTWESHACDSHIWFNIDQLCNWYPYTTTGPYTYFHQRPNQIKLTTEGDPDALSSQYQTNPWTNDYTIPNLANAPILPAAWWWHEMKNSIVQNFNPQKADLFFCGTEYEQAKYLPEQFFIKMIPLFDSSGTLVETTANISIKTTLTLSCKKRRSAIYCPTWGPFSWRAIYSAQTVEQIFQPALVRYRTGGLRRTWQNLQNTVTPASSTGISATPHAREDPYIMTRATVAAGTGTQGTRSITTTTTIQAKQNLQPILITVDKNLKRSFEQTKPTPPPRGDTPTHKTELAANTYQFHHMHDTQL